MHSLTILSRRLTYMLLLLAVFSCSRQPGVMPVNQATLKTDAMATPNSFFVDGVNGNDSNDGRSLKHAWKTIQKAFNTAVAGSVVSIKGGVYNEALKVNVSGSAGQPITFQSYNRAKVIIDGSTIKGAIILSLTDQSNLVFKNMLIRNLTKVNAQGILIDATPNGGVHNITFSNITIQNINWTASAATIPNANKNAQAFIVYGEGLTQQNAVSNLVIDSCEVSNNILGFSEAISLDGNIDGFTITHNRVHDNTNIGIAAIGHYATSKTPALDQARNGVIIGNTCYNDTSRYATSGGIYVDGGRDIVIERNLCYKNGYGVEVGNEENGSVSNVTVADNIFYSNQVAGLAIGGYTTRTTGQVLNSVFRNNTFFRNGTLLDGSGEIYITKASGCTIANNVFYTNRQNILFSMAPITPQANNVINYNCWYTTGASATIIQVNWPHKIYKTFAAYRTATGQDANSIFADPRYISITMPKPNFHLMAGSRGLNTGNAALVTDATELDFDGNPRLHNGKVDIGAYQSH